MVLGIGEGSIEIQLPKLNYVQGEVIKGKVILKLNAPKRARELRVELIAEQIQSVNSPRGRRKDTRRVYTYKNTLKGEGEYISSEYDFELTIPKFGGTQELEGIAKTIVSAFSALGGGTSLHWYIVATLDLPLSFDITKRVTISVV